MATSKKSTGKKSKDPMSSVAVTHVSLSVRQVSGEVKKIQGICGHGSEQPLASYDPDTQSWKMFGDISLWGDSPSLENLPVSGMTQSGVLYLQHPWEPITAETALSSWPTPVASDAWTTELASSQVKEGSMHSVSLGRAVQMWPTPTTMDYLPPRSEEALERQQKNNRPGRTTPPTLKDAVAYPKMWPTPTVDDASNVNPKPNRFRGLVAAVNETWPTPTASDWKGRGPNSKQQGLPEVVKTRGNLWPTPTTVDTFTPASRSNPTLGDAARTADSSTGKLNPTWVEWLMGFPEGWTDLED
jgi:DNA (cytosine-5)-methyltransferase 1